ncbi:hypothetical protein EX30DRAFT_133922 [Ascodesmis nigricans]|uniref:Integral membrane protein, Mpv17/PMP22 family n=1 Tax=Ascodesmis nigricans TaxID=341454 RepID=A0A4S2MNJ4_9PEZI|nr:hypothetical protein EX30DRAFT_133922 [Ascodesmis nigricans]
MSGLLAAYQSQLAKRPLAVPIATTAFLFGTGDVISQQAIEKKGSAHEFARTGRMALYGGAFFAPLVTQWYKLLQRIQFPGSPMKENIARVAADQLIFAPFGTGLFFTVLGLLEGNDPRKKLEDGYKTALLTNWKIWPAVQLANFSLVPLQHRLLVVNVVSLGWNSYLSWLNTQTNQGGNRPRSEVLEAVRKTA